MRRWIVVLALFAAACGGGDEPDITAPDDATAKPKPTFAAGSEMDTLQKSGKLRVGVKIDQPQFGLMNPSTDEPEGFDVDFARAIADELGVKPEFTEAISNNRIEFLKLDKVDMVFATMTVTTERKAQIDFTNVYYVAGQSFLTKKDKPLTLATAADKNICSAKGSTSVPALGKLQPKAKINELDGYSQCFQALQNDQTDAVWTDDAILAGLIKNDPAGYVISEAYTTEPYGGGVKKGRAELLAFADGVIKDMKEDGRWQKIYDKWIRPITKKDAKPPADEVAYDAGKPAA